MKSLKIKNYKNLKDFKIDSLSRVNLIVGKNNVGKSSLLEAISIFAAGGDVNWLKKLLEMRGINLDFPLNYTYFKEKEIKGFSSLYSDSHTEYFYTNPIQITSDLKNQNQSVELKLVKIIDDIETDENGLITRRRRVLDNSNEIEFADSNIKTGLTSTIGSHKSLYLFTNDRETRPMVDNLYPFEYVQTSQISSNKNPRLFDNITLTPLQKHLVEALQIIEPQIDDINFLKDDTVFSSMNDDNRVPFVVFRGSTERYRLTTMGDGMNRILSIILALLNCKDGILLIDEFENGLHYSVQSKLWQMIYKLAEDLNVHVFATTHSDDCIKSFVEADTNQNGNLIRLENRNGQIVSVEYNEKDELDYISTSKLEVR